jgi:hypothetical protein
VRLDETSEQLNIETREPIPENPDNPLGTTTNTSPTASPISS